MYAVGQYGDPLKYAWTSDPKTFEDRFKIGTGQSNVDSSYDLIPGIF